MKPLGHKNYGSIPHLLGSKIDKTDKYIHKGQHEIMTKKTRDKNDFIIVTEKYDGSNVGVAMIDNKIISLTRSGYLAKTSPYTQHHYFHEWVIKHEKRFRNILKEGERVVGEWLLQVHSVEYVIQNEPFVIFDMFDKENNRILSRDCITNIAKSDFESPRILMFGYMAFPLDISLDELQRTKHYSTIIAKDKPEGVVYKCERNGKVDFMAKYVRPDHESGKYIINKEESELIYNINPKTL